MACDVIFTLYYLEKVFYVAFCIACSVFYYFNVIFSGLIVGEERALFLLSITHNFVFSI